MIDDRSSKVNSAGFWNSLFGYSRNPWCPWKTHASRHLFYLQLWSCVFLVEHGFVSEQNHKTGVGEGDVMREAVFSGTPGMALKAMSLYHKDVWRSLLGIFLGFYPKFHKSHRKCTNDRPPHNLLIKDSSSGSWDQRSSPSGDRNRRTTSFYNQRLRQHGMAGPKPGHLSLSSTCRWLTSFM